MKKPATFIAINSRLWNSEWWWHTAMDGERWASSQELTDHDTIDLVKQNNNENDEENDDGTWVDKTERMNSYRRDQDSWGSACIRWTTRGDNCYWSPVFESLASPQGKEEKQSLEAKLFLKFCQTITSSTLNWLKLNLTLVAEPGTVLYIV